MTQWEAACRFAQTAQKWRDLVNRRCAHFVELHKSGRWKQYYSEAKFLQLMREAAVMAEAWSVTAPRPEDDAMASGDTEPVVNPPSRSAA
jgi:uncharacterized repeat protein (TIGR03809 family)